MSNFSQKLIAWQKENGRNDLPWQVRDPYVRWLSEVMLQQTQVATVLGYFDRFIKRFPSVESLACASEDEVMTYWAGLGYYTRARNLHRCAKEVVQRYQGKFPRTRQELESLPGIGRSTAAAIAAFGFGEKETILDGNVKRVLTRFLAIEGAPNRADVTKRLWEQAEMLLPDDEIESYIQGLMDLGALVCTRTPKCLHCPVVSECLAHRDGREMDLPTPNPKKSRPEKTRTFLLLWNGERIWLERRCQKGVWQGLFSLPEIDGELDEEQAEMQARDLGFEVRNSRRMETIVHDFSHYRLHINPIAIAIKKAPTLDDDHRFVEASSLGEIGLPAPIEVLLSKFFSV